MTVAAALNLSGRQRMLAQRAAKAWIMRGLELLPARATAIQQESLALQQKQLAELKGFVPNDDVRVALGQLERDWAAYRTALAPAPASRHAGAVYDLSEQVQERAHRLTLAYEKASRAPTEERLINIAGRQRMLSQRLAKFYLFGVWGVHPGAAQMQVDFARAEFSSGMSQLAGAVGAMPVHRAALEDLDRAWIAYRELFSAGPGGGFSRRAAGPIAEGSEQLLPITERLVALFEQQAASRSS